MSSNEYAEYTFDITQLLVDFLKKWVLWGVICILICCAGISFFVLTNKKINTEEIADTEEIANTEEVSFLPVDSNEVLRTMNDAERDSVETAMLYYQVVQERKDYLDNSPLNQLDANSAKAMYIRYGIISDEMNEDIKKLTNYLQSEQFYSIIEDAIVQYKKEYVSEVLTITSSEDTLTIFLWLPDESDEETVFNEINNAVLKYEEKNSSAELYSLDTEKYEIKHVALSTATNNLLTSTNNYISALNTLNDYLNNMSEKALVVYYNKIGESYDAHNDETEVKGEETEIDEVKSNSSKGFKIRIVVLLGEVIGGLAVCFLIFICSRILLGRIYSKAIKRNMGLDYSDDLWVVEKNKKGKNKDVSFDLVTESINDISYSRKICLLQVDEIRNDMEECVSKLEKSVKNCIINERLNLSHQPILSVADRIEDRETELIFLLDIKKVRYGRLAQIVYEFNNLGFERISCICLH